MKLIVVTDTHGDKLLRDSKLIDAIRVAAGRVPVPLIHLGDWVSGQIPNPNNLFSCRILVQGNNDCAASAEHEFDLIVSYIAFGPIIFSHEPMVSVPQRVSRNLHGHLHRPDFKEPAPSDIYSRYGYLYLDDIHYRIPAKQFCAVTLYNEILRVQELGYG